MFAPGQIEIVHGGRGRSVQRAGERRHGRREDGRHRHPHHADRQVMDDEGGKDLVVVVRTKGRFRREEIIEAGQGHADEQEKCELPAHHQPAQSQRAAGLLLTPGA